MTATLQPTAAVAPLGTILGVWAHPDDEAYLSAGLMATARRNGQRVVVVTATAGEHGTPDPHVWPPERLAARRRRELVASLAALDVQELRWLGFEDGGCADAPLAAATDRVAQIVAEVQPDTIVTFGPDGMTGHPDHRAVSAWTSAAWAATGRRGRLLHATVTPDFHAAWAATNDRIGIWVDQDEPPCTPASDLAVVIDCDHALLDRKLVALRAHASQTDPLVALLGEDEFRRWWQVESFVAASAMPHRSLVGASH